MKRFKNILLVYKKDSNNVAAFKKAISLVLTNGAKLKIVEVLEEVPYYLRDIVEKERKKSIKKMFLKHSNNFIPEIKILIGKPFIEIIKEVIIKKHDLVIMEPIEPIGYTTRIFSSLSMHLLRKCPCPVWILRPDTLKKEKYKVLAAIDAKNDDNLNHNMNVSIMELASSLSIMENYQLHIAHAWKHPWEEVMIAEVEMTKKEKYQAINEIRTKRKKYINDLVSKFNLESIDYSIHLEKGEAIDVIPEIIAKEEINLIVMGTVIRSSIMGLIMGNTCEDILQQVNCSVLALKPEGFESPIQL